MKNPVLITGVTGTVGNATARELARKGGHDLIIAGRNPEKLEKTAEELRNINKDITVQAVELDLSSKDSVKKAVAHIRSLTNTLSSIINVAAVYKRSRVLTEEGLETMFATNHLGPFILTTGLIDLVKNTPGARVITVSAPSFTKLNFDDLNYEQKFSSLSAFGASKMANLLFTNKLAEQFENTNAAALNYHPGLVRSELMKELSPVLRGVFKVISSNPAQTARTLTALATDERYAAANGKFYDKNLKELKANVYAYNKEIQEKLWAVSEALIAKN